METRDLQLREEGLEEFVEKHLTDSHGLILSWIDARTLRPFSPETFVKGDRMRHPAAKDVEDFGRYFAYENSGMCTGAWLAAQTLRHEVTGDRKSLSLARAAFAAIRELYRRSQEIAPGFLSKFHQGKLSPEVSTDQCLYVMVGLDRFAALATSAERAEISEMITGMADFWRLREYRHPYRERDFDWPWPLNRFPVMMWLAWRYSGRETCRLEFERLVALEEVRNKPPFFGKTPGEFRREAASGETLWPFTLDHVSQGQLSLQPLLESGAPEREVWLAQLETLVECCLPSLGEDGLQRGHFFYDERTGRAREVNQAYHSGGKPNPVWEAKYFVSPARSGLTPPMFARALLMASSFFPGRGWEDIALNILNAVNLDQMRFKVDPRSFLPENQQWLTHCLCGDAVVNWCWSYWLARKRGLLVDRERAVA